MSSITAVERAETPAVAEPAPRSKRKQIIRIAVGAAMVAAVAYGGHWWSVGRFIEDTDDAYVGGDVTVIGPKVPGYITQLAVTDNQFVHAGDLLVKIDDRDYRAAVARAEGAVAAQEALLANLDATERLQQAVIGQAKAGVVAADAETTRSRDDEARYRDLSSRSAVSVESAQRADATYKTAQAGSDKAQAALVASQRQIDVIDSQKQQARAALMQAKAELEIARLNEGYTELRAPVDGVVGNRRARVGAFAAAGTQLLSVVPAHGLWVDANFKEDQLARMHAGEQVDIRADVLPGKVFHGHLASLAPATGAQFSVLPPENATGNFTKVVQRVPVRVVLDGKDDALGVLRPGLSVVAEVDTRDSGRASAP
ncbi:HlyD family secretion protein [Dyella soli]|uniref:HlyD family secretion protein n=1 Tax=Dyella soli TaxID=522319 RepID=A0A4R0YFH3_9GAMM|nr:HlyD family secretion protein [Dyella soli]TCI06996.1 HlyD family secretion protein [Dyella soli]